jgi:hypothetical protein
MASFSCAIRAARRNISPVFTYPAQYRGLDLDTGASARRLGAARGFLQPMGRALLVLVCLRTAFGVHLPAGDQDNMIHFYKNLVMTGGFLYVIAFGPGGLSVDREAV